MSTQPEIIMYARERFCPDVTRARGRLTYHGIAWTEYNVEADESKREDMIALTGEQSVPQLIIGERILIEPSENEIDAALVAAGFEIDED